MRRVHHHWEAREEYAGGCGMWRNVTGQAERQKFIDAASALMADPDRFHRAMLRAVAEWPNSCETNLTGDSINQRAWLGHAGCYLATGSPEDCTRLAWHTLDPGEQHTANAAADRAIAHWRASYFPATDEPTLWDDFDA